MECSLRGRVCPLCRDANLSRNGTGKEEKTAVLADHNRNNVASGPIMRFDVDVHHVIPFRRCMFVDSSHHTNCGVADQNVDSAESIDSNSSKLCCAALLCNVSSNVGAVRPSL